MIRQRLPQQLCGAALKIFPVWIGEKLSSVTSLPLPSGAVMAGIFIAILYVIAAGAVGI
ncbi:MAG: hypothetical protein ACLRSY_09415 [Acutalibacter sp.]